MINNNLHKHYWVTWHPKPIAHTQPNQTKLSQNGNCGG